MLSCLRSNNRLAKSIFRCSKHFVASSDIDRDMIHEMVRQDCQMIKRGAKVNELYQNDIRKKLFSNIKTKNGHLVKKQRLDLFNICCMELFIIMVFVPQPGNFIAATIGFIINLHRDLHIEKSATEIICQKILPKELKEVYQKNIIEDIKFQSENEEFGLCQVHESNREIMYILDKIKRISMMSTYKNYKIRWADFDDKRNYIFYMNEMNSDKMFIYRSTTNNYIFSGLSHVEMVDLLLDAYKLIPYDDEYPYFYKKSDYDNFFIKE